MAVSTFIRRNIAIVLAVPPVVAAAFGIYAKMIRQKPQRSTAITAEHTVETELNLKSELTSETET